MRRGAKTGLNWAAKLSSQWSIKGTSDFHGDGNTDIFWQDSSGNVAIWEMNGTTILNQSSSFVGTVPGSKAPATSTFRSPRDEKVDGALSKLVLQLSASVTVTR
jgi:hypothetical protein